MLYWLVWTWFSLAQQLPAPMFRSRSWLQVIGATPMLLAVVVHACIIMIGVLQNHCSKKHNILNKHYFSDLYSESYMLWITMNHNVFIKVYIYKNVVYLCMCLHLHIHYIIQKVFSSRVEIRYMHVWTLYIFVLILQALWVSFTILVLINCLHWS